MATYKPTDAMKSEAQKGLDWRREHGRGGTEVGIARARDIVNGKNLSESTVKRMYSFFSRHEVDKQAEGFSAGEDGYPSNGRIAWALWGGDAGFSWSRNIVEKIKKEAERELVEKRPYPNEHAARLVEPSQFDDFRRESDAGGNGIDFIYGLKDNSSELQSIRFDAEIYTADEAREWLSQHDFSPIEFEPAIGERMTEEVETVEIEEAERFDRSELTFRAAVIESTSDDDRRVRMSLSSEEPVERSFGSEVLEHNEKAIDMSRIGSGHAPLLLDHDMTKQIGVIENAYLDQAERKLRAVVRFGKGALAREVYEDIKDGIRSNVSIGYIIRNMEQNERSGTVSVNSWVPYEASIVSVPADASVGVNRNAEFVKPTKVKEDIKMTEVNYDEVRSEAAEAAKREFQKNAQEIIALAVKHNKRDLADQAIAKGMSINEFRGVLLDALPEGKPLEQSAGAVEMNKKEQRDYSFMKAVRGLVNGSGLQGLEREISDEIAKRQGREARGFYAPDSFWTGRRDLTVGTDSAGGYLKPTDHLGDQFVDALRARLVFNQLGARFMSGLRGDVAIPKLAGGVSAGFVAENGATSEVNATFAQITMSPKSLGAFTDVSRLLMIQSDPSVEQIVRDDLLNAIAQKIEDVAIEGGGTNEPTGILGTAGIGSVAIGTNGGNATWASIVNLVKEVEIDNAAINGNTLAYLTNPKVKAHLSQTSKVASTDSVMIMNEPWSSMYGYNVSVTNNVPSDLTKGTGTGLSALIFGDFSQAMFGIFSTSDVLVDPYTGGSSGAVRIRVMQEVDFAVRHAQSFAAIKDITA